MGSQRSSYIVIRNNDPGDKSSEQPKSQTGDQSSHFTSQSKEKRQSFFQRIQMQQQQNLLKKQNEQVNLHLLQNKSNQSKESMASSVNSQAKNFFNNQSCTGGSRNVQDNFYFMRSSDNPVLISSTSTENLLLPKDKSPTQNPYQDEGASEETKEDLPYRRRMAPYLKSNTPIHSKPVKVEAIDTLPPQRQPVKIPTLRQNLISVEEEPSPTRKQERKQHPVTLLKNEVAVTNMQSIETEISQIVPESSQAENMSFLS